MLQKMVRHRYTIIIADLLVQWDDDFDEEDLGDAIDHYNHQANLSFQKGTYEVENIGTKLFDPEELLSNSVKGKKSKGWLKGVSKDKWVSEIKQAYGRDISYILKQRKVKLPIMIEDTLCDGYARVMLAYALGEKVPVALFVKG